MQWNWLDKSLRTKMLVMFVLLTVFPLILIGLITYIKSSNIVSERAYSLAQIKTSQITREIDVLFQDIHRFNEIGKQHSTVQFLLHQEETYDEAKEILSLFDFYQKSYLSGEDVFDIQIMNLEGKTISNNKGVYQRNDMEIEEGFAEDPTQSKMEIIYRNGFPTLVITNAIVWDITDSVIGMLKITIDVSAITSVLDDVNLTESSSFFITSTERDIFFQKTQRTSADNVYFDLERISEKEQGYYTENGTFYVYETSKMTDWKVIGQAPIREIMKDSNDIRTLIFLTVISSIIFIIGLYMFISNKLILPIRILKTKMTQAADGNLKAKVNPVGEDEIATLGHSFNQMISKIKSLLDLSIEEQKKLKAAEFRTMQAQINPHFLYNTLDTIVWLAETEEHESVIELTKALSQYSRISLNKGKDWITIADEMSHIDSYLYIQKTRYEDILDVAVDVDQELYRYHILKLLLQPIVENAIYHGIKNKRGMGFLRINGSLEGEDRIHFEVIDNGIGMGEARLQKLRNHLISGEVVPDSKNGFGLINVQQRIQLYYGKEYGLKINSWKGSGTRITITIPKRGE
ncbi:two-component system, sensor histidine kinase YesM [Gracilibacillus orientalis]|uniref:histidine kinase n=1 Tax=Gracilibacillus orientalis TaxID=334253 RepID=A0A1I4P9A4_9BACI|nr:sensor histidine kinase [Gracilibacillus orientalis]SFM24444.1 two-component system, sensor histidine kinase YesM [Gracilibacillus orientalis]